MNLDSAEVEKALHNLHAARNDPREVARLIERLVLLKEGVVTLLVSALDSPNPATRSGAALALGDIPLLSEGKYDITAAIPALVASMEDCDPWVAFHAAKSLWTISKKDEGYDLDKKQIVRKITTLLESSDPQLRVAAADELGWKRSHADLIIRPLIERLNDPAVEVRFAAARSLASFGPAARDAMPRFMEWLNSAIPEESFIASLAITKMSVPTLLDSFGRLGSAFRVSAAYLLREMLEIDHRVFPLLEGCYKQNSDRELRLAAVQVIAGFGLQIKEAVPFLTEAIHDEDREVACAAVSGLKAVGADAAVAVPHLITVLDAELARGDTDNSDSRRQFVCELCDTLGYIGPQAKAAMLCLRRASQDEGLAIRSTARRALRRIVDDAEMPTATDGQKQLLD